MLRKIRDLLGIPGIIVILLAPLLAAGLMALALPGLTKTDVRADGIVQLFPVTGTHAAYEAATYVADFNAAMTSAGPAEAAAQASGMGTGEARELIEATRIGDNTAAQVAFVAPTAEQAEAGLRAAVKEAAHELVQGDVKRAEVEYEAARQGLPELLKGMDQKKVLDGDLSKEDQAAVREGLLQQATQRVEAAHADLATAKRSATAADALAQDMRVDVATMTDTATNARLVAGAAVSALLGAIALVLFLRRDRFRSARPPAR